MPNQRLTLVKSHKILNGRLDEVLSELGLLRKDLNTKVSHQEFETVVARLEKDINRLQENVSKLGRWITGLTCVASAFACVMVFFLFR